MTLVLTINGSESIWLLADRRLSSKDGTLRDDARKAMILETTDGAAILGYTGLGATARGTEPADWMSAVLRGRNMPLERSLGTLADAMKAQFPRHMVRMATGDQGPTHSIIVPALLNNDVRLYTIDLAFTPDRKSYTFRYTRHVIANTTRTRRLAIAGSGGFYLFQNKKRWMRGLLRIARAHDRGSVSEVTVADHLANLNYQVHLGALDKTVGPRCVVVCRHRKGGVHKSGGGHWFYTGTIRDEDTPALPTIVTGIDMAGFATALMPGAMKMLDATRMGQPANPLSDPEVNERLARLSHKPDENLR
jgi:hypothetical protein